LPESTNNRVCVRHKLSLEHIPNNLLQRDQVRGAAFIHHAETERDEICGDLFWRESLPSRLSPICDEHLEEGGQTLRLNCFLVVPDEREGAVDDRDQREREREDVNQGDKQNDSISTFIIPMLIMMAHNYTIYDETMCTSVSISLTLSHQS
jgi:hypothetical protein